MFRRYKHAGLPIKLGYKLNLPFPFTNIEYNFYSVIFIGKDPFRETIPLPFSDNVIESYKILIHGLQSKINDVVENKIESIKRRTNGILPKKSYSARNTFTNRELSDVIATISNFNTQRPIRAHNHAATFPMNIDLKKEMKWYIDLEKNMEEWKKIKDIDEE
jgi:hypothetical protein